MNLNVMMKSISKTRNIKANLYTVSDNIHTLKDLIMEFVNIEIDKYENNELKVISQKEIDDMLKQGKVSFGFKYRESKINRDESVDIALQAQIDGLVVIFINGVEIKNLNDKINLKENDEISILRLTMFAGRFF